MTTYRWSFEEDVERYKRRRHRGHRRLAAEAGRLWRRQWHRAAGAKRAEGLEPAVGRRIHRQRRSQLRRKPGRRPRGHAIWRPRWDTAIWSSTAAPATATRKIMPGGFSSARWANCCRWPNNSDVVLAIEPMHAGCAEEWTFLDGPRRGDVADSTTSAAPICKLAFDTYHLGHDPRIVEQIARDRPAHRHRAPGRRQMPAAITNRTGIAWARATLPLTCIVKALQAGRLRRLLRRRADGRGDRSCDYGSCSNGLETTLSSSGCWLN